MRRRKTNPRNIKRASKLTKAINLPTVENRLNTSTGFETEKVETKGFTTYKKLIAGGCADSTFIHPKKTRVYYVTNGQGTLLSREEGGQVVMRTLIVGDRVECKPGVEYKLASFGSTFVEVIVVEDSKFNANVKIIADEISPNGAVLPENEVTQIRNQSRIGRTSSEKTKQQQKKKAIDRARHIGDSEAVKAIAGSSAPTKAQGEVVVNPNPDDLLPKQ